jgi:hypothetical protein
VIGVRSDGEYGLIVGGYTVIVRYNASKIAKLLLRESASSEALYMGWLLYESTGEGALTDITERHPPRHSQDVQ